LFTYTFEYRVILLYEENHTLTLHKHFTVLEFMTEKLPMKTCRFTIVIKMVGQLFVL